MNDSEYSYRFSEQRPDASLEMAFSPKSELAHVVRLSGGDGELTWEHKLPQEAVAATQKAMETMEQSGKQAGETGMFQLLALHSSGPRVAASWNKRDEDANLVNARRTLETQGHAPYVVALAYFKQGESRMKSDHDAAGASFKAGIAVLGNDYIDTKVLDDTGMKSVAAKSMEKKEGLGKAAGLYRSILESRLSIVAHRDGLTDAKVK